MNILLLTITSIAAAELPVLIAAMVGGAIIVFGLIVERFAELLDDRFIPQYKAHKWLEDCGLAIVILGLLWEIATGGWAAHDAWQTKQMTVKNDPLNQPIARISAIASFRVRETNFSEIPTWGNPTRVAAIACCESNLIWGTREIFVGSQIYFLDANNFERYGDDKTPQYVLHFHVETDTEPIDPLNRQLAGKDVGWVVNQIHFLDIETKFLPPNAEILDGQAVIMVNDCQKWFNIPAQKDLNENAGKWGYGYIVAASDETLTNSDAANIPGLVAK